MLRGILRLLSFRNKDSGIRTTRLDLSFPNASRSYCGSKKCVRFSGYDTVKEISFFLEVEALSKLTPHALESEAAVLRAFDEFREHIEQVAGLVYAVSRPSRSFTYHLSASDF